MTEHEWKHLHCGYDPHSLWWKCIRCGFKTEHVNRGKPPVGILGVLILKDGRIPCRLLEDCDEQIVLAINLA